MIEKILAFVVKQIVDKPAVIRVSLDSKDGKPLVKVLVDPTDISRVIGSEGRVFRALRGLTASLSQKQFGELYDLVVDMM